MYFIDSVDWRLHYSFAAAYLDASGRTPVGTHEQFNLLNYRRDGRRFVLGKLVRYRDQDLATVEMSAGDTADVDLIAFAFARVAASVYDGDALRYRPVSAHQEALLAELGERIPVIASEAVFAGQDYQPLHQTVGHGTLRFVRLADLPATTLSATDIAVFDGVPDELPLVSGVITSQFQTPLSHINLLAKNRGTPNMALRDAFDAPALRAFEGSLVRLQVGPQEFVLAPSDAETAQLSWDQLRPAEDWSPVCDDTVIGPVDIAQITAEDRQTVGAKAANMGEMTRVSETAPGVVIPLPEAPFALPFAHYRQHLQEHPHIGALIDALLAELPLAPEELETRLFEIRWAIFSTPMSPALASAVADELRTRFGEDTRVRFRSSTNVEDLELFSGAGLYTSAGATWSEGLEAIESAIKVVWASAWNLQAFVERDFYRVDHQEVCMAVLVHPAFEDEEANGVAITINEFSAQRPAYYINSQIGEHSVSNPVGRETPEQILYYTWYEQPEYEVITRSSLLLADDGDWPAGVAVLTDAELAELATFLGALHSHFRQVLQGGQDFALDVEFKLAPGRQLFIKQARPLARRVL